MGGGGGRRGVLPPSSCGRQPFQYIPGTGPWNGIAILDALATGSSHVGPPPPPKRRGAAPAQMQGHAGRRAAQHRTRTRKTPWTNVWAGVSPRNGGPTSCLMPLPIPNAASGGRTKNCLEHPGEVRCRAGLRQRREPKGLEEGWGVQSAFPVSGGISESPVSFIQIPYFIRMRTLTLSVRAGVSLWPFECLSS